VILGLDTATPATVAAAWAPGTEGVERRDDPAPGERPRHAERLLPLLEAALAAAGGDWADVERLAVGVGPGGFTGLRIGIATARALAQARELPLAPVSSLEALARGAEEAEAAAGRPVAAVIDARRGEAYAAAWAEGAEVLPPAAYAPDALAARLPAGTLAAGDGAIRFRAVLEAAGATVPADGAPAHRVSALWVCRLGAQAAPAGRDALLPDYRREPDAVPPTRR
jgi:tRNA threonylcarbamoyladenosine biosynthesis protein TsaB